MHRKIIIFCFLLLTGCASPNENDIVVSNDIGPYNESIFPAEYTKSSNATTEKPDNDKTTPEKPPEVPQINVNLFKDKPPKLQQILGKPRGIVIDKKGEIFLIDQDKNKVFKFAPDGKFLLEWGSIGTENEHFQEPKYLSISNDDNIIVSDTWNGRLQFFDTNGKYLKKYQEALYGPKGTVTRGENVYLADTGNHCIKIMNKMGKVIKVIGKKGEGKGEFNEPTGMTYDDKGNLYIVDSKNNRIVVLDDKDNFIKSWKVNNWTNKEEGKESWLVYYKDNIYMTDPITSNVRVFDTNGKEKAPLFKNLNLPSGLFLYKNTLYVVEGGTPKVITKKL